MEITKAMGQIVLDSGVATARKLGAGLDVRPLLVRGLPPAAVLEAGREAELIVLGSRGHGGFGSVPRMLLGPVTQAVLHEAPCPVAVVHVPNPTQGE
jgi:nucleotide-binding universal stress UspA family protein